MLMTAAIHHNVMFQIFNLVLITGELKSSVFRAADHMSAVLSQVTCYNHIYNIDGETVFCLYQCEEDIWLLLIYCLWLIRFFLKHIVFCHSETVLQIFDSKGKLHVGVSDVHWIFWLLTQLNISVSYCPLQDKLSFELLSINSFGYCSEWFVNND